MTGPQLAELLDILRNFADAETSKDPATIPGPTWIGRVLFRQLLAVYTRKDHGPNRGIAARGRWALLRAAWRFARGSGAVPRLHRWLPETTFERIEQTRTALTPAAEEVLERYYLMKVGSLQFCGAPAFGVSFWEGFHSLMLTFPILMWVARAFADEGAEEGVLKALSIVDDHFGFNKMLGTLRQRFSQHLLSRRGETTRLIARYSL
jgi:lysine-N-methylase